MHETRGKKIGGDMRRKKPLSILTDGVRTRPYNYKSSVTRRKPEEVRVTTLGEYQFTIQAPAHRDGFLLPEELKSQDRHPFVLPCGCAGRVWFRFRGYCEGGILLDVYCSICQTKAFRVRRLAFEGKKE